VFETGPIHALQSLASAPLTGIMWAITLLGYFPFYLLGLAVIMFGVDLRKGLFLSQLLLWTLALTDMLKTVIALPRPVDVDASLRRLDSGVPNRAPFASAGATAFFGLPSSGAIEYYRTLAGYSFGFPSGHVSSATTFWGGAALLFRRRWLQSTALAMVVLMALSRMYLGRHFLGDVLGGSVVGIAVLVLGFTWYTGRWAPVPLLGSQEFRFGILALVGLVGAPLILFLLPGAEQDAGRLLGLNLGYLTLALRGGLPADGGPWRARAMRIVLAIGLSAVALLVMSGVLPFSGRSMSPLAQLLVGAVPPFVMLTGTVLLGGRLGFYPGRARAV
jgi:membrane-associated phospholipid phosphatase